MNLQIELSDKQTDAIRLLQDNHTTEVLYGGGAGSGKSILGSWWILKSCIKYPGTRWVIGRSKLKTLKETTLKSLQEIMKMCGVTTNYYRYNQTSGTILFNNGSEILLKDLFAYPSDPDFDELGSLEITGAFIDEASQITVKAKNILKSRIRYKLDEFGLIPKLLMTTNPCRNFLYRDYYIPYTENKLPKERGFVHALLEDNPFISPHYRNNLLGLDKESKERLLYGNWQYLDNPLVLCNIDAILDLYSNDHVQAGPLYITADIARFGADKSVILVWSGLRVIEIKSIAKSDLVQLTDIIKSMKMEHQVPMSNIYLDESGVGGGVLDMLSGAKGFQANKKPISTGSRQNYRNLKAQCMFTLAEYINQGKIWIRPIDYKDEIIEELEQLKKSKELTDDKLDVIKKDEQKEMLGRSPDFLDALSIKMMPELDVTDYFS